MADRSEQSKISFRRRDELLDQNLRELGSRVTMPADPTPIQQVRWKQSHWPREITPRRRIALWLGSSSAAAAAIVLIVALLFSSSTAPVSADIIWEKISQILCQPVTLKLHDVAIDYTSNDPNAWQGRVTLNGQAHLSNTSEQQAYLDLQVGLANVHATGADDASGITGQFELVTSIKPNQPWCYIKLLDFPDEHSSLLMTSFLFRLARNGLYINLDEATLPRPPSEQRCNSVFTHMSNVWRHDQLQKLIGAMQRYADQLEITEHEDGLVVLRASGMYAKLPDVQTTAIDETDRLIRSLIAHATLTVGYYPNQGVRWLEIEGIGPAGGSIRIEPTNVPDSQEQFDLATHMQDHPAPVLNLNSMLSGIKHDADKK